MNQFDLNVLQGVRLLPRSKAPSHRHGTPSGPWPFLDLADEVEPYLPPQPKLDTEEVDAEEITDKSSDLHWSKYPQSHFANWTPFQQSKSGIAGVVNRKQRYPGNCSVYKLDVWSDGTFHADKAGEPEGDWVVKAGPPESDAVKQSIEKFWENISEQPSPQTCVRALFVDNLSGPVLQMLGAKFNIEPFFFSSSLKCIPSRYQEQAKPGKGDHITITLNFIRTLPNPSTVPPTPTSSHTENYGFDDDFNSNLLTSSYFLQEQIIDIQGPLILRSNPGKLLISDLLAIHVIRRNSNAADFPAVDSDQTLGPSSTSSPPFRREESSTTTASASRGSGGISTIISYHPPITPPYQTTSAKNLHARLLAAGRSVYWSHIFSSTVSSGDPTFVVLSLLWYAMYAWDEALEVLLGEVGWLESQTLSTLPRPDHPGEDAHQQTHKLTHQLHAVRAHLLHYENLLSDFKKSVMFLLKTTNPASLASAMASPPPTPKNFPGEPQGFPEPPPSQSQAQRQSMNLDSSVLAAPQPLLTSITENSARAPTLMTAAQDTAEEIAEERLSGGGVPQSEPAPSGKEADRERESKAHGALLKRECKNLLDEIQRLEMTRAMLDKRLGNVMALAFASVNIEDSRRMQKLAEASSRDSAVMKQISYLTMIFLPASFVAAVFGMNVVEIAGDSTKGTLSHYLAAAIPLTLATIWVMMLQYHGTKERRPYTPSELISMTPSTIWRRVWSRVWWPLGVLVKTLSPWTPTIARPRRWSVSRTGTPGTRSRITSARTSVRERSRSRIASARASMREEGERGRSRAESWVRDAAVVLAGVGRSGHDHDQRDRDRQKDDGDVPMESPVAMREDGYGNGRG